ncbi:MULTISPECIES: hypothetical protein [Crocosphaera]|uniref:Uncharacterized protein n=4 Tax=Crocosphaera watsonii TaxID=263511 RepID=T2JI67_CROWT|nr:MULTISPECIES: hypothetical protein [Crocosphaera]MCH2244444.1 hypothetical protein [Crocosphaera sp.]CCQ60217.1 hypothetical protein CWATWH0401_3427 [Crocosphaera watsonii WH 0401]CCQ64950.1 hypothetical protein CWATWH0402_814 [Crocosphaera watsonii WH 0402]
MSIYLQDGHNIIIPLQNINLMYGKVSSQGLSLHDDYISLPQGLTTNLRLFVPTYLIIT